MLEQYAHASLILLATRCPVASAGNRAVMPDGIEYRLPSTFRADSGASPKMPKKTRDPEK